jgi:hypothetical protein
VCLTLNHFFLRVEDLVALEALPSLKELGLGNNPVTKQPDLTAYILQLCPKLQILDSKQVTDQARIEAEETINKLKEKARLSAELMAKDDVIDNAKKRWEFLKSEALKMSKTQKTFHHVLAASGCAKASNQAEENPTRMQLNKAKPPDTFKTTNKAQSVFNSSQLPEQQIKTPIDPDELETIFPLTARLSRQNGATPGPPQPNIIPRFRPKTAAPAFHPLKTKSTNLVNNNQGSRGDSGVSSAQSNESGARSRIHTVPSKIDLSLNPLASVPPSAMQVSGGFASYRDANLKPTKYGTAMALSGSPATALAMKPNNLKVSNSSMFYPLIQFHTGLIGAVSPQNPCACQFFDLCEYNFDKRFFTHILKF